MPYRPIQIANEIIARYGAGGQIEPMKLQKLLYFADGWYLALTGQPLLTERPQVWRYGPVFRSVYRTFNRYGSAPIRVPESNSPFGGNPDLPQLNDELDHFLNWLWNEYGHRSGPALSDETHKRGTPWRKVAEANKFVVPENTEIPVADDWEYFSTLARERGFQPQPLAAA